MHIRGKHTLPALALAALIIECGIGAQPPAQATRNATRADFDQYMKDLSNWGPWGKDDQMGAFNLITPAKRKQAMAGAKQGATISLAGNADLEPAVDNPQPIVRKMTRVGVGQATTGPGGTGDTFFISSLGEF